MLKPWHAKITGDMTLSILDEDNLPILKVDILSSGTMKAGTDGDRLCRAMNDLTLLALSANGECHDVDCLPFPEVATSQSPWSIEADSVKRRIGLRDASGRTIAHRVYPKSLKAEQFDEILLRMKKAIEALR